MRVFKLTMTQRALEARRGDMRAVAKAVVTENAQQDEKDQRKDGGWTHQEQTPTPSEH